jgi:hypothetical protein
MKFRNPWIDPRVIQVKASDAETYLLEHGWVRIKSAHANKHAFASSTDEKSASVVQVAQLEEASDFPQRMIELIGDLATIEDRYAGDVLSDILHAKSAGNGAAKSQAARSAAS